MLNSQDFYGSTPDTDGYGQTYTIISMTAFLLGVSEDIFIDTYKPPRKEIYDKLQKDKPMRIIRNLCTLRTAIERNFKTINEKMRDPLTGFSTIEEIPQQCITELSADGIRLKNARRPVDVLIEINELIKDRINNCRHIFPDWLKWDYYRNIFIMPNGNTEEGTKIASDLYYANLNCYPYRVYLNMIPSDSGNILYNDKKFMQLLYKWNHDEFTDYSKVCDAKEKTKNNVYEFLKGSHNTVIVVDCENADPYNLCATLLNLDDNEYEKISKISLYDDIHTSPAWKILENYVDIPIEYNLVERVHNKKSLVDIRLATGTCKEFYEKNVDSFIIVSSDSDYWGLISDLPDARFLVMVEHGKAGPDIKNAFSNKGIFYCYLDEFYSGNSEDIKIKTLLKLIREDLDQNIDFNIYEIISEATKKARIEMTPEDRKQFFAKQLKDLRLTFDENGKAKIELNPLK